MLIVWFLTPYRYINTADKHVLFGRSYWIHVTLARSVKNGTLRYYVNDILIHEEHPVSRRAISGTGTLRLGYSVLEEEKWFNGLIAQFNIYNRAPYSREEIGERIQKQHCCHDKLPQGNWLSWSQMIRSWTLHGSVRVDKGVECTSFESTKTFVLHVRPCYTFAACTVDTQPCYLHM